MTQIDTPLRAMMVAAVWRMTWGVTPFTPAFSATSLSGSLILPPDPMTSDVFEMRRVHAS